ncbi:hypothetical protein TB2_004410 [Malus domestica]
MPLPDLFPLHEQQDLPEEWFIAHEVHLDQQSVLRFLRNVPSRWRITGAVVVAGAAGVAARAAGVVTDEVSPLDIFAAQVNHIPRNVLVATGAILLDVIPYEDVWNYVSDTATQYETMVRRARRNFSPGSSPR